MAQLPESVIWTIPKGNSKFEQSNSSYDPFTPKTVKPDISNPGHNITGELEYYPCDNCDNCGKRGK